MQIFYDPTPLGLSHDEIVERASKLPQPLILYGPRLVFHIQTSEAAVDDFLQVVRELSDEKAKAGFVWQPQANVNGNAGNIYVRRG